MAKKEKKEETPSLFDFNEENLLDNLEQDEEEIIEEEEIEEEEEEAPKKKPLKKEIKKKPKAEEVEEEIEEEPEEEVKVEETPINQEEEEENPNEFWERVEQLGGIPVDVEYGDVDPSSPEGIVLRDKAIADKTVEDFVTKLQNEYPDVYEALEYAHAGGNIEELFKGSVDYSKVSIAEDDEDHARAILEEYYKSKQITNVARIKRMIAADEEDEAGIVKIAQAALQEMQAHQAGEREEEIKAQQAIAQKQKEQDVRVLKTIEGIIGSGQLSTFKITSRKDAEDFNRFVKSSIQRDGKGGYMFVTPIEPADLEKQLQAEFFKFKKGNLESLVTTKANTLQAQKLRLNLGKEADKKKTTVAEGSRSIRSLRDFDK